jgi:hypothetical protein
LSDGPFCNGLEELQTQRANKKVGLAKSHLDEVLEQNNKYYKISNDKASA